MSAWWWRALLPAIGAACGWTAHALRDAWRARRIADDSMIPAQYRGSRQLSRAYMRGLSKMAVRHATHVRHLPRRPWWRRIFA